MAIENKFYVDFDTKDGGLLATTITIGSERVTDPNKEFNIALAAHPRYVNLERYVLANPSGEANIGEEDDEMKDVVKRIIARFYNGDGANSSDWETVSEWLFTQYPELKPSPNQGDDQ